MVCLGNILVCMNTLHKGDDDDDDDDDDNDNNNNNNNNNSDAVFFITSLSFYPRNILKKFITASTYNYRRVHKRCLAKLNWEIPLLTVIIMLAA